MALAAHLVDLVLPRHCLGCHRSGSALCADCRGGPPRPHRPDPTPPGYPSTWVGGPYRGALRAAVLAYKERGRTDLRVALATLLAATVRAAVPAGPVLVVPVPSARSAARRRGGDHVRLLARATAGQLRGVGVPAEVLPALALVGRPRDSADLSARERSANLTGAFVAAGGPPQRRGTLVIVDDVVTTGTTLTVAADALRGWTCPVYAAVLAGTQRHRPRLASEDGSTNGGLSWRSW